MVRLTRIYTRGGDSGETSLGDGARVPKHALRVAAYGTVDEANAVIGIARLHAEADANAMLGTLTVLGFGVASMLRGGDPRRSNKLMQSRVMMQALALALLAALMLLARH